MQVDFYIVPSAVPQTRERFVCKLAQKVRSEGRTLYIHTASPAQTRHLDQLLWTFRDDSFLAHDIYPDEAENFAPVRLGHIPSACPGTQVLLNLADPVPAFFRDYSRILEVVSDEPGIRDMTRRHYRFYQSQGLELHSHNIPARP